MNNGDVVEFDAGDRHLIGAITRELGEKYIVITEEGDEMRPTGDEVTFGLGRTLSADADTETLQTRLEAIRREIDDVAGEIDVGFLWEFVRDDERVSPASLCELFFESQKPEQVLATRQRLREDPLYFKARGNAFEPRSESQIEELERQLEARREEERRRQAFLDEVAAILAVDGDERGERDEAAMADPEFREFAETLQEYAIYDQGYHDREEALELLDAIEDETSRQIRGSYGAKAFWLMVDLGIWDEHENLWLHRYNLSGDPDDEVVEAVEHLEREGWEPGSWRRDWTERRTFSIDDPETRDIDDALSCRRTDEGMWEVGIHVADPSAHVDAGDPLDRHARGRGSSVYLPTGTIPMFPEQMSEKIASLVEGKLRPAISVVAEFDDDFELVDHDIAPTVVCVDDRLEYAEADAMLEEDDSGELGGALEALRQIADARREERLERGALSIDLPDPKLQVRFVGDDVEVECGPEERETPAHELVSEFMILANTLLGKFCRDEDIPVIYRAQESPDDPLDDAEIRDVPAGLPRQFAKLRRIKPGVLTTEPSSHFGLGVSAYTQATSPIRRYADLVCQRQVKAYLADESLPHDHDEMVELLGTVETTSRETGRAQSETERYWLLEYLRRNADRVYEALVIEHYNSDGTRAAVWVNEVAQKFTCNFRKSVPVGETAEVVVESADPRADEIALSQA
jgi:exoribonuclease-2